MCVYIYICIYVDVSLFKYEYRKTCIIMYACMYVCVCMYVGRHE